MGWTLNVDRLASGTNDRDSGNRPGELPAVAERVHGQCVRRAIQPALDRELLAGPGRPDVLGQQRARRPLKGSGIGEVHLVLGVRGTHKEVNVDVLGSAIQLSRK
jgi:hypothetical protein